MIIDLSIELHDGLQTWFIFPKVVLMDYHIPLLNKDRYKYPCQGFSTKLLAIVDHVGTHVDAPSHFVPDGPSIEQVPLEKLIGDAVLLDVSFRPLTGPVKVEHLEKCVKQKQIEVREGDIIIIRAWPGAWGTDDFNNARGLTGEAIEWVLDQKPKAVGTDLAGVDDMQDPTRPAHLKTLQQNIPIIENLINLDKVMHNRFKFIGLPLKIRGGTASPIRAIAIVPD